MEEKRESKTMKEIYEEKYNAKKFAENPLYVVEAIGYIKALIQFMPAEKWIKVEYKLLMLFLPLAMAELKRDINGTQS